MGSRQTASFLKPSSGAGIPVGLAMRSGGDFRAGKTRSAIARSTVPLFHHRLQHDYGRALIRPAEPRKLPSAQQVLVWAKPGKNKTESQNAAKSWAKVVRGEPMKDMTAVPPPPVPPASAESQVPRRVPMDIISVGVSLAQVQDRSRVASLPSPASAQQMDTSRVGAASLTQVQNSTQVAVQISLSHQQHDPPSWQTLPHSFRCSCHQCKRS